MTFLKQGKTNWKYILIVLILALIVGGGILGYLRYFKREMISLTKFPEIKKPEKVVEEKPEVKDGLEEKTVSEKASIPLDIINSDEELSKYLIEKLSLDKNTKFTFIRGKLDKDSDKETIPFFSYTSPTTAMAYRGIIQENLEGFFITVFEDDPCYCFKVNVYTKKMVSDQPEFIISNYLPLTGTCVAFDVVSILTIGEGISFENEFKNIWQGFTYECTILHQSTIADIEFKDLDGDNNLEIIQKGYVIDCGDECCCKEGIKKEEFQKIFKWNEETQSFEEMITDFMDARMGKFGEESLIRAKSHLTDNGKKSYSQIEFIDFALVGISNPHYSRYEILKSEKLNSNKFEFTVRIYEYLVETKEKGDFDYFDEELIVIKIDNNYLVDSVERGETVMIQGETADWKTYRNGEYGFEIKYPSDFYIRKETKPGWIWIDSDSSSFKDALMTIYIGQKFALSKTETGGLIYYEEYNDEIPKKSPGNILVEDVIIDGIPFQKEYYVLYGGAGAWSSGINVYTTSKYQGNYYLISLDLYKLEPSPPAEMWDLTRGTAGYLTEEGKEWLGREMAKGEGETIRIFNQILSTFRFLE